MSVDSELNTYIPVYTMRNMIWRETTKKETYYKTFLTFPTRAKKDFFLQVWTRYELYDPPKHDATLK